jgi:hypothetical protein
MTRARWRVERCAVELGDGVGVAPTVGDQKHEACSRVDRRQVTRCDIHRDFPGWRRGGKSHVGRREFVPDGRGGTLGAGPRHSVARVAAYTESR